ncbi:hypothetical protein PTTG_05352 [Puccinia triticina 1-1 BBBD Race 1]|uniref:Uncharacterized protein n=1 Tax=Puccinia triticina (isolate 1-1 / race 1 (BBBD)) TaxID=630390 RepID=A0A180H1X5_PUCT1|nr:hypothetical protein PTTG_05352 [Puccinia triticina 1-1 BBBD Race 1]
MPLAEINTTIDQNVSPDSLSRWNSLYRRTRDVVRDPALYLDRGRLLAFSREEAEFVLIALRAEPTLYLDEIQSHIQAIKGTRHPISTIAAELKTRLLLTKKVAQTYNTNQDEAARFRYTDRIGHFPPEYLVFLDKCGVSLGTHARDTAWATCGQRTTRIPKALRVNRVTVMPAVSLDGLLGVIAQVGSMCRLDMQYFIETVLVS